MSKRTSDSLAMEKEDGELSGGDSPVCTPLKKLHKSKMGKLNPDRLKDSLERPRCSRKQVSSEEDSFGSEDASENVEGSLLQELKFGRAGEISIAASGYLEDRSFTSKLSVPDRRELRKCKDFLESFNELFSDVKSQGGKAFKDMFDLLSSHIENIELFLEEYGDDARAAKKLRVIESVMKLFQKVANPLSNSKGFGSKLLAIMNTRECGIVFGQLDVSLTVTSVKTSARGSTATLFQASPYKLATWSVRAPSGSSFRQEDRFQRRWPHGGKKSFDNKQSNAPAAKFAKKSGANTLKKHSF